MLALTRGFRFCVLVRAWAPIRRYKYLTIKDITNKKMDFKFNLGFHGSQHSEANLGEI